MFVPRSSPNTTDSQTLRPMSYVRPHSAHLLSPASDIVGPSPVTSNGTETTEIDDEEQETVSLPAVTETRSPTQVRLSHNFCRGLLTYAVTAQDAEDEYPRSYTESLERRGCFRDTCP